MKGLIRSVIVTTLGTGLVSWGLVAQADMVQIKAYKEAYPDAMPKCIDCHAVKMPKKEDGKHDPNDYGKLVIAAAKAAGLDKPTVDTYKKVGPIPTAK